ncbi:helix-turn-helix domain-containing protein [Lysinibacillus sp. NPDC093197]|uniref:helix-turn-helix domain-containing protein n=1 Tax=Lysinibacillus sp. NPDC093197 TaxID=3364132 RepID=UPI00380E5DCC
MENYSPRIIPKIFMRYYEIMDHTLLSEEEKQLTKLAFNLLNMRIEKNISQDEVIARSGLSKSVVSKMETFNSIPSSITLAKYAKALGMELILVDSELFNKWKERSKHNNYL